MRRYWLSVCVALALAGVACSTARAEPCTVGVWVHNHASIWLKGQKLASCDSATGCKCVSCWNILGGAPASTCYPLFVK
jgi:hypothetical protein